MMTHSAVRWKRSNASLSRATRHASRQRTKSPANTDAAANSASVRINGISTLVYPVPSVAFTVSGIAKSTSSHVRKPKTAANAMDMPKPARSPPDERNRRILTNAMYGNPTMAMMSSMEVGSGSSAGSMVVQGSHKSRRRARLPPAQRVRGEAHWDRYAMIPECTFPLTSVRRKSRPAQR